MNKIAILTGLFVVALIFTTACSKKTERVVSNQQMNQANPAQVRFCLTSYRGWVMTNRVLDELSQCLLSR